jgi:AcrR family transcriptional regulator
VARERTSAGDPARTLALLWRDSAAVPRHGPPQGLSIDAVVARATQVADDEGLQAVTMRQVAKALGVAPMTLYTYVPGKAELLDLMLDAVYMSMPRPDTSGQPWRQRLAAIAEDNKLLFEQHPWAAKISTVRPPLGPGMMAKYEHELSALEGLGLDDVQMDASLTFVLSFVQTWARAAADVRAAQKDSAIDDNEWWATSGPLLARVLDGRAYPIAARVGSAAGAAQGSAYSPGHAYTFGLARVLDGLSTIIDPTAEIEDGA